jgi:hypothetical protein
LLVVVIAYASGSSLLRSVVGGVAAFLLATGWTWWRLRVRERMAAESADRQPE